MSTNDFDQDKDFQALHEKYQAESTELPPAELDLDILQAAHQAVDTQPRLDSGAVALKPRKHTWYRPMSYVAILVLSLSVVMRVAFEPDIIDLEFAEPEPMGEPVGSAIMAEDVPEKAQMEADEMLDLNSMKKRVQHDRALKARQKQTEVVQTRKSKANESQIRQSTTQRQPLEKRRMLSKEGALSKVAPRPSIEQEMQGAMQSLAPERMAPMQTQAQVAFEDSTGEKQEDKDKNLQSKEIDNMLKLLESEKFEQLRLALTQYRITYPFKENDDSLPDALRLLEIKWQAENK